MKFCCALPGPSGGGHRVVGHQVVGHQVVGHAGSSCCCSAGLCQSSFGDEAKKRKQFRGNVSYLVICMCLARFCGQRPLGER